VRRIARWRLTRIAGRTASRTGHVPRPLRSLDLQQDCQLNGPS
jgi:hypothetical protein